MATNIDTGLTVQDAVNADHSPHIFTMSNGDLVVIYYDGTNLVWRSKSGGSWSAKTTITLDTGVSGTPMVSYWTRNGNVIYGAASKDPIDSSHNADFFELTYTTSTHTLGQTNKQLDNSDGNEKSAGVAYTSGATANDQVLQFHSNAAGSFTTIQETNVNPTIVGQDQSPTFVKGTSSARTGLVSDGSTTTYLMYGNDVTGTAFAVERFVAGTLGDNAESPPAPAANPVGITGIYDGSNYYFIINENNAKLRYLKRTGTNTYGSWTDILSDASLVGQPAVCVKANGDLALFYRTNKNQANGEIWVVQRTGGTWGSASLLAGGASTGWANVSCAMNDTNDSGIARLVYVTGTASTWTLVEDSYTFTTSGTSWNQSLTDNFSETDVRLSQPKKALSDATSAIDSLVKLYQSVQADTFSETDVRVSQVKKGTFAEFISQTDSVTRFLTHFATILDAFSETDTLGPKTTQKVLADATSALDALTKLYAMLRTDAFSLVDLLSKIPAKALAERFSETDALNAFKPSGSSWNQLLTDKHSALDVVVKQITKVNADAISALDTFAHTWLAHLLFTDLFSETDAQAKAVARTLSDSLSGQDLVQKLVTRTLSEATSATDMWTKTALKALAEALSGRDALTKSYVKPLFEAISQRDSITAGRVLLLTLLDHFAVLDSLGVPQLSHPISAKKITIAAAIVAALLNINVTIAIGSGLTLVITLVASGVTITASLV